MQQNQADFAETAGSKWIFFLTLEISVKSKNEVVLQSQCGNVDKTKTRVLRKKQYFFRQINVFTKAFTKELISRNFFVIAFYMLNFSTLKLCTYL